MDGFSSGADQKSDFPKGGDSIGMRRKVLASLNSYLVLSTELFLILHSVLRISALDLVKSLFSLFYYIFITFLGWIFFPSFSTIPKECAQSHIVNNCQYFITTHQPVRQASSVATRTHSEEMA